MTYPIMTPPTPLLTIDEQPISIERALKYLQTAGMLDRVITLIIEQHLIHQDLQEQDDDIDGASVESAIINFRRQHQLTEQEAFQAWLTAAGLNDNSLRDQVSWKLRMQQLKARIIKPKLHQYFISQKLNLDRVVLSRIVVQEKAVAEELLTQIWEDGLPFEQLAQEYSLAEDRTVNGRMGEVSRGKLPHTLRAAVDQAQPGAILGPLPVDGVWYLLRLEEILPIQFDSRVQEQLAEELFEQWLQTKKQESAIQLDINL